MSKATRRGILLVVLLAATALAERGEAAPYNWVTVAVDGTGGAFTDLAVDLNGDLMVSYLDATNNQVRFALCDRSASAHGTCDQASDWSTAAVGSTGWEGIHKSLAVDASGNPLISYQDYLTGHLNFATCDRSASTNGNCDQPGDWSTVTVDPAVSWAGLWASIAVDLNGNSMISYVNPGGPYLKFAICQRAASAHGNCDQQTDWSTVTVGPPGWRGSIAADQNADPMLAYYGEPHDLKFAICDRSASTNGNCDQQGDWATVTPDGPGDVGDWPSVAVDANGDPLISYQDWGNSDLKFATCDRSASANGKCDQPGDWRITTVDAAASVEEDTSLAVGTGGDLLVCYYDGTNDDLRLATCDVSTSMNGNCDQTTDWQTQTVVESGDVGRYCSIVAEPTGRLVISYYDATNGDLDVAIASPPSVGGIAELPDTATADSMDSRSADPNRSVSAAVAGGGVLLLAAAWYATRRWLRRRA